MRLLILFISLLISKIGNGQIINASPPYRVTASCSLLLDCYGGASVGYSLRKLRAAYSGSAIRVRRSSDNTESDIGFTANGDLDTASMKTFVGTGGTDDGFVVTWYDQSGNSEDATQSTSTAQPLIIDNGVVLRLGSNPTILFDGTSDYLTHTQPNYSGAYAFFGVVSAVTQTGYRGIYAVGTGSTTTGFMVLSRGGTDNWGTYGSSSYRESNTNIQGDGMVLLEMNGTINSTGTFYLNGASDGTYAASEGQADKHIGGSQASSQFVSGRISEIVSYSNSSPSRSGIAGNINTYYSIY